MSTNERYVDTCPVCNGTGKDPLSRLGLDCANCDGTGLDPKDTRSGPTPPPKDRHADSLPRPLNFSDLERACQARNGEWWQGQALSIDKKLFFAVEIGEEAGEVCGVIKKLHRQSHGMPTGEPKTLNDLADELADLVITAQNVANTYGINLGDGIRRKFNATSEKRGFNTKL